MWVRSQEAGMRENKHKNGSSVNCAEWPVKIVDFKISVIFLILRRICQFRYNVNNSISSVQQVPGTGL